MNKIILIGNLTRDPELGTTQSGISYCRFSIAVNRRFSRENQEVDYFNIVAWRGLAESCGKNLTKGRKVGITGPVQIRNYEGNDGQKRTSVEVTAEEVEFLSPANRSDDDAAPRAKQHAGEDLSTLDPVDEELPF